MDNEMLKYIPEPQSPVLLPAPRFHLSRHNLALLIVAVLLLIIFAYKMLVSAPNLFPSDTVVHVSDGQTLSGITQDLKTISAIKSPFIFKVFTTLFGGTKGLMAGDYYLENPQNSVVLAWRFSHSAYGLKNIKVTIPEGLTTKQIADIFSKNKNFTHFISKDFIEMSKLYEGYLFPDTYLFLPNVTATNVAEAMIANYKSKIEPLLSEIISSKRTVEDTMKMASILEEEGRTEVTRKTISGILWKRLDKGMPLQVDASIMYASGKKDGNALSQDDFKIDSPYNTYLHKGLPPTPISNPGLDAIIAAIHPLATKYYFYLTDQKGGFYPAVTYDEHLVNKEKYLK